ncbi:MAG: calcium/sodium antiporter [Lentisphaeria bacterium]|nr:calcium/sodium antiporter [Lentisphaeria bacterium]NQZ67486.1 calcium/sodium antiporter [Lentisphaeria bacterium]
MTTDSVALNILIFIVGLTLLVVGSDWFIDAAAYIAHKFDVPDVIIGLTLVSIGTSLPEFVTNMYSSYQIVQGNLENEGVALGNIVGSNITNVLLVLGVAIVFMKNIPIDKILFQRDTVIMAICYIIFLAMIFLPMGTNVISRVEGCILLSIFIAYMAYLFKIRDQMKAEVENEAAETEKKVKSGMHAARLMILGGAMVVFGAQCMVDVVVKWAVDLGVATQIISATIIAFGTSVPELAITLSGILKKKNDIALGNIIGSNIFNLVFVLGASTIISPIAIDSNIVVFTLPVFAVSGALLVIFMRTGWALVRWEGFVFLAGYIAFIAYNVKECLAP